MKAADFPITDRKLDALVAEKVMGKTVEGNREVESETYFERFGSGSKQRIWQQLPRYSTDRNALVPVLERVAERGLMFDLCHYFASDVSGMTNAYQTMWAGFMATPRQLCEAALKAVGVKGIA